MSASCGEGEYFSVAGGVLLVIKWEGEAPRPPPTWVMDLSLCFRPVTDHVRFGVPFSGGPDGIVGESTGGGGGFAKDSAIWDGVGPIGMVGGVGLG
jgi:hypothetical protein